MQEVDFSFLAAFLIGLAGAGHCFGMCGGIAGTLSMGTQSKSLFTKLNIQFLYNFGRIISYAFFAFVLTSFFSLSFELYTELSGPIRTFAGIILILTGLYLIGLNKWILKIEAIGKFIWKFVSPTAKSILPVNTPTKALAAGFLWGWLPCGLAYSSLLWVSSTGEPLKALWLMVGFGLGTMPAMLLTGIFALQFKSIWVKFKLDILSGIFLVIFGIWTIPLGHNHAGMDHAKMDHSQMNHDDMSEMDHAKMDHSQMNHDDTSEMDHAKMDHSQMNHDDMSEMDHAKMDHSQMNHDDMSEMDHAKMDHSKMDHAKMDHSQAD
ncbi:sulfite exporter TauE/SafE family protein [Marinomonas algicola]|uniref:sulfite exporter TauE/SafE family protein n=1 Tax=Marinomonas algicola TaxID=2773454 RepID=UPI00174B38E4|nr:sulfite exporter TauE/SafE family protein [Marinomonas algicola]